MKDTSLLSEDNEFKGLSEYPDVLRRVAAKTASWHNVSSVAASEDLGNDLWHGGIYRLMELAEKMASDLAAWLASPNV